MLDKFDKKFTYAVSDGIEKLNSDLAYLALTSKPEHAVRDSIALTLYNDPQLQGDFKVAREWHLPSKDKKDIYGAFDAELNGKGGIDLALLKGSKIELIAELKAMYSFDVVDKGARICAGMKKGIERDINLTALLAKKFDIKDAYVIVLVFLPWAAEGKKDLCHDLEQIARYKMAESKARMSVGRDGHKEHINNCRNILANIDSAGHDRLEVNGDVSFELVNKDVKAIHCGSAYGVNFDVYPFILKVSANN